MRIRRARQILKCLADDTRLRTVNLLYHEELNVTELCGILEATQSNISKHLTRLRLTGIVGDRRKGFNVYYYLRKPESKGHKELLNAVTKGLTEVEIFKADSHKLNKIKNKKVRNERRK